MKLIRSATVATLLLCLLLLASCGGDAGDKTTACQTNEQTTAASTAAASPALLSATGFDFDGDALTLTVPNATTEFSFADRFTVSEGATWYVKEGEWVDETSLSVTVCPLSVGDNRFTLGVFGSDGDAAYYPVVIRRRALYTVTFDPNGGTSTAPQTVEEDAPVVSPAAPTRTGYAFAGWNVDLTAPVKGDLTVTANWTPNTDTAYTVEYYLENAAGTGYDKTTEPKTGTTAATVTATQKAFDHFTYSAAKSTPTGTVSADGTLVLKMYYLRDTYTVTFFGNGGTLKSGTAIQTVRYGNAAAIPSFTRNGYTFTGWDSTAGCDAVAGDLTVTAQWQTISYSVTYDPNGGTLGGVDPATYTVESDVPLTPPTRSLYAFAGWYDQDGTKVENLSGHFGNLTLTARWTAGFTVSDAGEITAILPEIRAGATEIVIPADLDGVAITSIGDGVFADCPLLTTVTIPEGIVSIGEGAFKNCAALTDVIWNAIACTVAGSDSDPVFAECPLLERAVFGGDVTAIPDFCFCDCSGLSSVTLSSGIGTIGERAFAGCASLTGIDLPDGLTAIGARAFLSAGLTAVSIPAGVQTVGDGAFQNCAALASVSIGVNVSAIGAYAFQGSGLYTATFLDENGWYVTTVSGANAGTDLSVSVPAQNAARLTTEYASYFWYKN